MFGIIRERGSLVLELSISFFSSSLCTVGSFFMTYAAVKSMGRLYFMRILFLQSYDYRRFMDCFAFILCATSIWEMMYYTSISSISSNLTI